MRKFAVPIALVVVPLGYLFLLGPDGLRNRYLDFKHPPARTPQEAMDRFVELVRKRDYEAAALYLDDDAAEQFKKAALAAGELGEALDNLRQHMKQEGVRSAPAEMVLHLMEPFPTRIKVHSVKQHGLDRASAVLVEDLDTSLNGNISDWPLDPRMVRPLFPGFRSGSVVELRRHERSRRSFWKVHLPVTGPQREAVDYLTTHYQNYVRGIQKVKDSIERDVITGKELENALRTEMKKAAQP